MTENEVWPIFDN